MNRHHTCLLSILTGLMLSILTAQDPFVIDSSLSGSLPQSIANSIEIADVDDDGYNDIIMSGYDSTRFGLFIDVIKVNSQGALTSGFSTNFITYSDTIAEFSGGLGNLDLSDVDLDGSIDIYLNGSARSELLMN